MRTIDADALKEKAWDADTRCGYVQVVDVGDIDNAPTIEPQRKKGKWIKITTGAMREKYMCSICGRIIEEDGIEKLVQIRYPFCHCGAEMEGQDDSI